MHSMLPTRAIPMCEDQIESVSLQLPIAIDVRHPRVTMYVLLKAQVLNS
jgi:hypothetical protein